jgi:hypothetical protein
LRQQLVHFIVADGSVRECHVRAGAGEVSFWFWNFTGSEICCC